MTANPPHPPSPGGTGSPRDTDGRLPGNPLSGGTSGILAVTLAAVALALAGAAIAAVVSWLV